MNNRRLAYGIVAFVIVAAATVGYLGRQMLRQAVSVAMAHSGAHYVTFPSGNASSLSPVQQRIVVLAQGEYAQHPLSYDARVLTYTDGHREAWCANFASWLLRQAGVPYSNPNSGSWRIPGVLTLQSYYKNEQRYTAAGEYRPRVGDVAFFIRDSRLFARQHVAVVVDVQGDTMTTLGGNDGGKMLLRTQSYRHGNDLVGFGRLPQ